MNAFNYWRGKKEAEPFERKLKAIKRIKEEEDKAYYQR